jgi:serine/threonine protein phosphatase 1
MQSHGDQPVAVEVSQTMLLKRFFNRGPHRLWEAPSVPKGERVYAIGDVHGRLDLLDQLLDRINADDALRDPAETKLVFVGDLVNRGPESRGVIERLMELRRDRNVVFLKGNHEEILIKAYSGNRGSTSLLHRVGGRPTLMSYGVSSDDYDRANLGEMIRLIQQHVPGEHVRFLDSFSDWHVTGDYLFVHAGIRPGRPIADQKASDLRWIREEFLNSSTRHPKMIVHGHSIRSKPDVRSNRIGIDTGAFGSGTLTALGLEGPGTWFLTASGDLDTSWGLLTD